MENERLKEKLDVVGLGVGAPEFPALGAPRVPMMKPSNYAVAARGFGAVGGAVHPITLGGAISGVIRTLLVAEQEKIAGISRCR